MSVALRLYSLLMRLGQPLLRRKLARRGRTEPGYLEAIEERFGHYTQPAEAQAELVWLHAVSLGETRTAAMLLKALRVQHPGLRLLLTHGTATGRDEGAMLLRPGDVQVWQPWDSRQAVARFYAHFKPRLGLVMETEVWPNLVACAQAVGLPLVLVNGRLSEKSLRQALRLAPLSRPAYAALTAAYAQTQADAMRFRQAGAKVAGVFGNLKFDATPDDGQLATGKAWRQALGQPVMMFASSREGEEAGFFKEIVATAQVGRAQHAIKNVADGNVGDAFNEVSIAVGKGTAPAAATAVSTAAATAGHQEHQRIRVLVVPRHPQRFAEVQALAESAGLTVSRRSTWAAGPAQSDDAMQADVWLGDTLGEMALYYAMSDVALLGGSFAQLGGQNLIEAAACGCPIVMGPHTFNFSEAAELAEGEGAARRVTDMVQGVQVALALVSDPIATGDMVKSGLVFAERNRGATVKTLDALPLSDDVHPQAKNDP
jgi:3-deoxy-D-manno-octulosonic-acid transferase